MCFYGSNDGVSSVEIGEGTGDEHFDLAGIMLSARYLKIEPVDTHIEIDGVRVNLTGQQTPCFVAVATREAR